jgi:hypothetical protein
MDQQRPRDNAMYYLSEKSNLKQMDKAILNKSHKHALFDHRVLSAKESKRENRKAQSSTMFKKVQLSRQELQDKIWNGLKLPKSDKQLVSQILNSTNENYKLNSSVRFSDVESTQQSISRQPSTFHDKHLSSNSMHGSRVRAN